MNANNNSMNSSRPLGVFNELSYKTISSHQEEAICHLTEQNKSLLDKNTAYHTRIITLENQLKEINEKNHKPNNNTSSNFYLPSELKTIWENIANENIGDCFMDFFFYPHITYQLIQEMLFIIKSLIDNQLNYILNTTLSLLNFNKDDNKEEIDYKKVYTALFTILKPFLQENVKRIFENDNNNFKLSFMKSYKRFFDQEIKPILIAFEDGNLLIENFDIMTKSKPFEKTIDNMTKIILCIELNDQEIVFNVDNYAIRELKQDKMLKNHEVLNVNGKTKDNQSKYILISPPQTKKGFPYQSLLPIILTCDSSDNYCYYLNNKHVLTSPGLSLRSTSYQNINHYTTYAKDEKEDDAFISPNDLDEYKKDPLNEMHFQLETEVVPQEKTRTHRYLTNKSNIINALLLQENKKGHTRSLSKNTTDSVKDRATPIICNTNANIKNGYIINSNIGRSFADKILKSNKKPKIYKIKRQGKDYKLQEINHETIKTKKYIIAKNDEDFICSGIKNTLLKGNYKEEGKQTNNNCSTSISIIEQSNKKNDFTNGSHANANANRKGSTSEFYFNTANNVQRKEKKNKSIDRNLFDYKTNAATQVNVDDLLSFKIKNKAKKLREYRKTFTSGRHNQQID